MVVQGGEWEPQKSCSNEHRRQSETQRFQTRSKTQGMTQMNLEWGPQVRFSLEATLDAPP
jgi:hypothetical protein